MAHIKLTLLLLFSFLIIGCGFHLRGSQDLSSALPEVEIQGVSLHSELGRELSRTLTAAKVNVLNESDVILKISRDELSKRVLSLDSAGRANQYELSYHLTFSVLRKAQNKDKQVLIDIMPTQTITEKREYLFDANLVIEKADEETQLNNDMRQAAMLQITRRLMFTLKSSSTKAKSKTDQAVEVK